MSCEAFQKKWGGPGEGRSYKAYKLWHFVHLGKGCDSKFFTDASLSVARRHHDIQDRRQMEADLLA